MKWWIRLSLRLPLMVLLLAALPLAFLGINTIRDIRAVRLQSVAQIHKSIASRSAGLVESSLTEVIKKIQLTVDFSVLDDADVTDQEWILQVLIKDLPHLNTLAIIEESGQERVKVGRDLVYVRSNLGTHSDHPRFDNTKDPKPIFGPLHTSGSQMLLDSYIPYLNPVDRSISGVLVAEIDIEKLLMFTKDIFVGETGYVYVVNEEGKIIAHPDRSAVLAGENDLKNPLVQDFVSGSQLLRSNEIYQNRNQLEIVTNGHIVAEPRLLVVVAQSVDEAMGSVEKMKKQHTVTLLVVLAFVIFFSLYFIYRSIRPLTRLVLGVQQIGAGNFSHRIDVTSFDEIGTLTTSFNEMAVKLENAKEFADQQGWLKKGVGELETYLRGIQSVDEVCLNVISFLATFLEQQIGIIYANDGQDTFSYRAGYAFQPGERFLASFRLGEGLPGEAAREKKILEICDIPEKYILINAGFGSITPKQVTLVPFVLNNRVEAVVELGSFCQLTELQKLFLSEIMEIVAIKFSSSRTRQQLNEALIRSREKTEELNQQQEELQVANEELEANTQLLMASESKLKEQQEELQAANEELEEKTEYLERNKKYIENKNQDLEQLKKDLEAKALDLANSSRYKSEFLANMSHELRTPLNSLLLLARMLADNKEKNLSEEQIESAKIIYKSGDDLLNLINEILDLSRIEAGKMQVHNTVFSLSDFGNSLVKNFKPLTQEKGLRLEINNTLASSTIISDRQRVEQILKNFIANAMKFTTLGGVTIDIFQPEENVVFTRSGLSCDNTIGISVSDTGIGIPLDKQKLIFEAFQQLEGGSARKYGGTGLGLSISKELAHLLGGEIQLHSEENIGSTFTLFLPKELQNLAPQSADIYPVPHNGVNGFKKISKTAHAAASVSTSNNELRPTQGPDDDRLSLAPGEKTVLIIEDDSQFAKTLQGFCRKKGFKTLISLTGEDGLQCAEKYPVQAIILDINLPGIDGWAVLETLKENPATRHIPVHFMSSNDPVPGVLNKGAIGYHTKPISPEDIERVLSDLESMGSKNMKDLLLVEDDNVQRRSIIELIGDSQLAILEVTTGVDALSALRKKKFDCMILDLGLPDMTGFELLTIIEQDAQIAPPPVVVYTSRDLTQEEGEQLRHYSDSIIIKGVRSEERLLDETSLFLHQVVEKMPAEKRKIITALHDTDELLRGRNILVVDDDMRNVFALSKVLGEKGIHSIKAENGVRAIEILDTRYTEIDLILMDIMMPIMDGFETMKKIRGDSRFQQIPIIALTAKAMPKDKEQCIAAGANDYLAKPVDIGRLLSMMRVWLYR